MAGQVERCDVKGATDKGGKAIDELGAFSSKFRDHKRRGKRSNHTADGKHGNCG